MKWQEVCEHPSLQNLPFKIELNEYGKIVMPPVKVMYSIYQGEIEHLLRSLLKGGRAIPECAIKATKGTKVADVAWASQKRSKQIKNEIECSIAPEICIEVISSSNSETEMKEKTALYFESGAGEVWLCDENGNIEFFNKSGKLGKSTLASEFPQKITI